MLRSRPAPGRLARLVYAYTAVCVVGAIVLFLAIAAWHYGSRPPPHEIDRQRETRPPPDRGPHADRPPPPPRRSPTPPPDLLVIVGGVLLVLVAIASYFFARRLTLPLRKLEETAREFGAGDHTARVENTSDDEIGAASRAFDDMASRTSALIASQKELIANVSHELRTPLARMRVALDIAKEREQAEPALIESLDLDVSELQSLVGEVLETLRIAMTGELKDLKLIDLSALATEVVSSFRDQHGDRTIHLDVGDSLPCRGEPTLLGRALANVLENAIKYSEDAVTVTVRDADGVGCIDVIDSGVGIPAAEQDKVFAPFFRAERSRHRATGGVGLGLSLVKRIVEAHDGRVSLESEEGRGTTARIELPLANA